MFIIQPVVKRVACVVYALETYIVQDLLNVRNKPKNNRLTIEDEISVRPEGPTVKLE